MKAVIYCRVSTKDQVQNLSLFTQQKHCVEYCQRHNLEVAKVFVEEGESAKSADRTELKMLLAYCRENKGRIHAVVVYALNRFAREKYDHFALRALLQGYGITLRSATEPIDDSPTGKLMEGIVAAIAQFDNDVRAGRTVEGMKARLDRGGWTFRPPLGYLSGKSSDGSKVVFPDPERADLIRQAFELYASGLYKKRQVLDIVSGLGLRTKTGMKLSGQTFGQLLRKPIYVGVLEVKGWSIQKSGDFPPIVSRDTFERVQLLLDGKKPSVAPRMRNNPDFPLRNFVRCGHCDRPLTASWSKGRTKRYPYYRCQNRVCKGVNIRREELERVFVGFLTELQPKPEYARLFGEIIVDVWKAKQAEAAN